MLKVEGEDKEHHLYGGSSADQWTNCYGWASLIKNMPYEPAGKAADRGTALHKGVLEVKAAGEIKHLLDGSERSFDYSNIPDWPEEGPELAEDFWEKVWERVLEQFITGKTIYIEKKLMLFSELDCGGTGDFIVLYYNDKGKLVAVLGDCKFGKVRVEPDKEQLKFYLVALNKLVREKGKQIDEFKSFVYQPTHVEPFTEHTFTRSEIERAEAKYEKAIIESKKDKPKFKVGSWCEWCKVQGRCETYNKHLDKEMELMLIRNREEVSLIPAEALSDEMVSKIVLFGDKLTKYIANVKKEAFLRFMHRSPEENAELRKHVKIVEGRSNRVIKDESHVISEFTKIGANAFKEPELKGLGALESELISIGYKKAEAKKYVDSFTEKPPGKPKITTVDDPKPDYQFTTAVSMLEEYDDSDY